MDYSKKIQNLIRLLGFERNKDFADALGVSPARISNYVNGKSVPDFEFLKILKEKFPKLNMDSIFIEGEVNLEGQVQEPMPKYGGKDDNVTINLLLRQIDKLTDMLANNQNKPSQMQTGGL